MMLMSNFEASVRKKYLELAQSKDLANDKFFCPKFEEIQRVFYELHSSDKMQDTEFLNILFPSVTPQRVLDTQGLDLRKLLHDT